MKIKILVLVALAGAVSGCNERHERMGRLQPVSYTTETSASVFEDPSTVEYSFRKAGRPRVKRRYAIGKRRGKAVRHRTRRKRTNFIPGMVGSVTDSLPLLRFASLGANARVSCLPRRLRGLIASISRHYGRKVVINSGHRSKRHNRSVGGVRNSFHLTCMAVDLKIPGISKNSLARYVRSLPGRGGVGTYCGKNIVHVDIGPRRSWNYHCRGWRGRYAKR